MGGFGRILRGCASSSDIVTDWHIYKTTADFSRLWMGYWFAISLLALFSFRLFAGSLERKQQQKDGYKRQILVVGDGESSRVRLQKGFWLILIRHSRFTAS
ncbi:MAG: hypothetical protein IPG06_13760 [Haliea sp.]|nr:hypothetical protein [Haliea sp.]